MHSFVLQVLGIVGLSVMDCHHTPSEFQYLVLEYIRFLQNWFEKTSLHDLMMRLLHTSLGLSCYVMQRFFATPSCIHKSAVPVQWERGHDTAYKMAMTIGMKRKVMDCEFPLVCICHVASICHIKFMGDQPVVQGLPHEYVMTYWEHGKRVFHLSVLPLVFSILGMWHKAANLKWVHSLQDRKAVTSELCLLPIFIISDSYLKHSLQRE